MLYFKHMSNMRGDKKIRRIIARFGMEGYGLYNLIVESIVEKLTSESPLPELQDTCDDLAEFYNGNTARIQEMIVFMVNQGLLEYSEKTGRLTCHKVYKFLQSSQTRSDYIKDLIKNYVDVQQAVRIEGVSSQTVSDKQIVSDCLRLSQGEQNIVDKEQSKTDIEKNIPLSEDNNPYAAFDTPPDPEPEPPAPEINNKKLYTVADATFCDTVIAYLNERTGSDFRTKTAATIREINARVRDGYGMEDFKKAIVWCHSEWEGDEKMEQYLRPVTIFSQSKFPGYVENWARKKQRLEDE